MVKKKVAHDYGLMAVVLLTAVMAIFVLNSYASAGYLSITGNVVARANAVKPQFCNDTDRGLDYSQKGRLIGNIPSGFYSEDRCFMHYFLREVYCNGNRAASHLTYCRYGCENGMCKERNPGRNCGNGIINGGEKCDGANLNGLSCNNLEFIGGTLRCTRYCVLNMSGCTKPVCGNGVKEIGEICDSNDLNNKTCRSFGFASGTLKCVDCKFNTTSCVKACSSTSECGKRICGGVNVHETCENGKCVLKSNCTNIKCAKEGEYTSGTVAPEYQYSCCAGLTSFNTHPNLIGGGSLCYDPKKGTPVCKSQGTRSEGWYYSGTNTLLRYDNCGAKINISSTTCTDSDGGKDYAVQGKCARVEQNLITSTTGAGVLLDICVDTRTLKECYCENTELKTINYTCPSGCQNGACIKAPVCGDEIINPGEECDKTQLNGLNCTSFGFGGGTLKCSSNCKFDTSGCGNSSTSASLYFNPAKSDITSGNTVTLDIDVTGVTNLFGYQFDIVYNPAVLEFVGLQNGGFLGSSGQFFCLNGTSTSDVIKNVACTKLGSVSGASGSGLLNKISFRAIASGTSEISLSNVKLSTPDASLMSVGVTNAAVGVSGTAVPQSYCGDGIIQTPNSAGFSEQCDGTNLNGKTCTTASNNYIGGTLACTGDCVFDYSRCTSPVYCGDGVVQKPNSAGFSEECDGTNLGGMTCASLGYNSGTLACGNDCKFDRSHCITVIPPKCGDGIVNQMTEECDGSDFSGMTCQALGFDSGSLSCLADCKFDRTHCTTVTPPICGDGIINQDTEVCDGNDLAGRTCIDYGFISGTLRCTASCAADPRNCSVCNNNGVCQPRMGETVENCRGDCFVSPIGAAVYLNPGLIDLGVGDTVTFDIGVSSMTNLYGYQFDVEYDPAVLEFTGLQDGTFLKGTSSSTPFCMDPVVTSGLLSNVVCTKLGNIGGVSGSGLLKKISFRVLALGTSDVKLSNVKLVDQTSATMSAQVLSSQVSVT